MTDYVTRPQLEDAIAEVKQDIRDTETRLRGEWVREVAHVDKHLDEQDDTLKWILRSLVGALLTLLVLLAVYALTH